MKILSFDPGFNNFAWCKTNYRYHPVTNQIQFKIQGCGHLQNTITQVSDYIALKEHHNNFVSEINNLLEGVDCLAIERFQSRGVKSGLTQECVTMMIGIMLHVAYNKGIYVSLVTPAVWKNRFNDSTDLKTMYTLCWCTPHILDAFLIGYHHFGSQAVTKKVFKFFEIELNRDETLFKLEEHAPYLTKRRKVRQFFIRE